MKSALLASKKKTTTLLSAGAEVVLAGEAPSEDWSRRLGPAPDIYSREINYWLLKAAIDLLKWRRDLGCMYVHTTDYPMHNWPPEAAESNEHLARLDELLGRDIKGKVSLGLYALGTALAFVDPLLAYIAYASVSIMWFIPDRRLTNSAVDRDNKP